jgi:hypothetical protein
MALPRPSMAHTAKAGAIENPLFPRIKVLATSPAPSPVSEEAPAPMISMAALRRDIVHRGTVKSIL